MLRQRVWALLDGALNDTAPCEDLFVGMSDEQWNEVYSVLSMHSVSVFVFDSVSRMAEKCRPSSEVLRRFIFQSLAYEKEFAKLEALTDKMASLMKDNDVKCLMLKGHTIASYYPKPFSRKSVDIDIYSPDNGERIDEIFREKGVNVDSEFYRHSHFFLNKVMVENHKCLLDIRGRKDLKALDDELKRLANDHLSGLGAGMHAPDAEFSAIFNLHHALSHFIYEGISFKFLVDWVLFLRAEREVMASEWIKEALNRHRLLRFAAAMTSVSFRYMGLSRDDVPEYIAVEADRISDEIISRFTDDLFRPYEPSHSHNIIKERTVNVRRIIKASWKPREFLGQSAFVFVMNKFIPILLGRKYEAD